MNSIVVGKGMGYLNKQKQFSYCIIFTHTNLNYEFNTNGNKPYCKKLYYLPVRLIIEQVKLKNLAKFNNTQFR